MSAQISRINHSTAWKRGAAYPLLRAKQGAFKHELRGESGAPGGRGNNVPLLRHQLSYLMKRDLCTAPKLKPAYLVGPTPPYLLPVELWNAWRVV